MILHKILLKDAMVDKPYTVKVNAPLSSVEEIFRVRKVRHVPVIDDHHILQGLMSQRDLYRIASPRKTLDGLYVYNKADLDQFILAHVMVKDVVTLRPTDSLIEAIKIMARHKYGCIPIVDENRSLKGIITQIDVLRAIAYYFETK